LGSAIYDDTLTGPGYGGLIAWSNDTPGLQVSFDNYNVCPLDEPYPLPVFVGAESTIRWPANQPVRLHYDWLARTKPQVQQFVDAAEFSLIIDGQAYTGLQEYWGKIFAYAGGYASNWEVPISLLSPGLHLIEYRVSLKEQVTDGFDLDTDGKLDRYGPGEINRGWVQFNVEVSPTGENR
jgi:hypothetical protein